MMKLWKYVCILCLQICHIPKFQSSPSDPSLAVSLRGFAQMLEGWVPQNEPMMGMFGIKEVADNVFKKRATVEPILDRQELELDWISKSRFQEKKNRFYCL